MPDELSLEQLGAVEIIASSIGALTFWCEEAEHGSAVQAIADMLREHVYAAVIHAYHINNDPIAKAVVQRWKDQGGF